MINLFLRAKHWQLFLFTFGIPILYQAATMVSLVMTIIARTSSNPEEVFDQLKYFPIMMLFLVGGLFGWLWSVGVGLQKYIPDEFKLPVNKFKLILLIPSCYIIFFLGFVIWVLSPNEPDPMIFAVIVPFHLLSMACIFYSLYFVSRTYKTAILQKKLEVGDYIGEFFMIWFFFIGVWILQPKINKMMEQHSKLE
ncbi:MAG: hypothetical protein IPM69_13930 [Ignavibacteria bacterium]|nr:hypothetical protein [Ignavibacteria bacterium]